MNERAVRTRDGGRFIVRPMTEDDADLVLAGFRGLSATSLRYRFFTPVPRITPGVADDLVRVDPAGRIVLLAFTADGTLAGGARAVREHADPATADIAITVGDRFQRRGLGSKLLKLLGASAMAEGIDRLSGHVLVDNPGGRGLLIANGAVCRLDEPGVLAFEIPLGRYRTVPALLLRSPATQAVAPAPPLALRHSGRRLAS